MPQYIMSCPESVVGTAPALLSFFYIFLTHFKEGTPRTNEKQCSVNFLPCTNEKDDVFIIPFPPWLLPTINAITRADHCAVSRYSTLFCRRVLEDLNNLKESKQLAARKGYSTIIS